MNRFKRILSIALVLILTISNVSVAAVAADDDYSFIPSASFTASGVTRVAGGANSYSHGTKIVAATPSGVPESTNESAKILSYAGEAPAYTTVTLTLDVVPDETPVVTCPNVSLSLVSSSDKSFTWEINGGNAQAGSTLDISATYKYDGVKYTSHAYSYVCDIETGSAYAMSYHTVDTTYTTHKHYAMNVVNARFLGSNVVTKLRNGTNSGNYYYNFNTGKLEILDSGDYNTSLYYKVTQKTDTGSSNVNSTHYGDPGDIAISHAYFDTSTMSSFADTGVKYVVNSGVKYDPAKSNVSNSYFNSTFEHMAYAVNNSLQPSTVLDDNADAKAKLSMDFIYGTGKSEFGFNTLAINAPLYGTIASISDGECFTINNAYRAKNNKAVFYDIENWLVMPVYLQVHKYDKSALRQAIEYVLNTPTDTIDRSTTTGKGINPQDWYYDAGFPAFLEALRNANAINQKIDVTQSEIDSAVTALYSAYQGLVLKKADYTKTDALIKVANVYYENHPSYLEEQFQVLASTVDALDYDIHILAQPAVEKQNALLDEALKGMKIIPADYTVLEDALAQLPEYSEECYTAESYSAWKTLYDEALAIVEYEAISYYYQERIPEIAAQLLAALDALEISEVDLEPIQTALALAPYDAQYYKDADAYEAWSTLYNEAIAYSQRTDLNAINNAEIRALALELTNAYNALELKDADTKALEKAVALIDKVNEEDCVEADYAEFKAAVANGNAILARNDLTILDNAEIAQSAQQIIDKYFALGFIPADKSALEAPLALTPPYAPEKYTDESYTAYAEKRAEAQEMYDDSTLVASDNEAINNVAAQLTQLFGALTLKAADTSALEAALALTPDYAQEDYTVESYETYAQAVQAGQNILARDGLTSLDDEEIDAAAQAITDAFNALELEGFVFEIAEGSTAVIDRTNGVIYGLEEGITDLDGLVNCDNCTLRYTETENGFGTGTKVEVLQKGEVVETFYIVIFGDVTGDGYVDAFDASVLSSVANFETEFEDGSAYAFAADLNDDGFVDAFDCSILNSAANFESPVSQTK
ncbi:MAG: FIVAR domain-containing protein [Clostridia bacterium]|nr:FIVAR domain-containing protein [Clostridia bacterium]